MIGLRSEVNPTFTVSEAILLYLYQVKQKYLSAYLKKSFVPQFKFKLLISSSVLH